MPRILLMTDTEIKRVKIIAMVNDRHFTQREGAEKLRISERHFRRLLKQYRDEGDQGLISGHRGKPSNNRMEGTKREAIVQLLKTNYPDFGPTLASEKLLELEGIQVSKETVRQLMIEAELHEPKVKKKAIAHPLRERKARFGEMVQIDGSYHAWLEDRAEKACLLLFIDDATSEPVAARFVPTETYFAYGELCKDYFAARGLPKIFYSDKFGVFRVNTPNTTSSDAITQFGRALKELDIDLICADSPQAKGRVERANQTFQDRLVKEMRLLNIDHYDDANLFLPVYLKDYTARFAVCPRDPVDAHRPLEENCDLDWIFSWQGTRIISKDLRIQFEKVVYQVVTDRPAYALQHRKVTVASHADGTILFQLNKQPLEVKIYKQQPKQAEVVSSKTMEQVHVHKPAADHPWRTYGKRINDAPVLTSV
jgi:transposase